MDSNYYRGAWGSYGRSMLSLTCARYARAVQNHTRTRTYTRTKAYTHTHNFFLPKGCKGSCLVLLLSANGSNASGALFRQVCLRTQEREAKKVRVNSGSGSFAAEYGKKVEVPRHQVLPD